VLKSQ